MAPGVVEMRPAADRRALRRTLAPEAGNVNVTGVVLAYRQRVAHEV